MHCTTAKHCTITPDGWSLSENERKQSVHEAQETFLTLFNKPHESELLPPQVGRQQCQAR